jgi:hypothetical protein
LDWEAELRRLLGEEGAAPAPPPPVIVREAAPPPVRQPALTQAEAPAKTLATLKESSTAYARAAQLDEKVEERMRQRAVMAEAESVYQQAARLDTTIEERLRQVTESPVTETHVTDTRVVRRGPVSPEIAHAVALLRQPRTARQAVLASVILAPPKALEMPSGGVLSSL